jgi:hypothetical protein
MIEHKPQHLIRAQIFIYLQNVEIRELGQAMVILAAKGYKNPHDPLVKVTLE